MGALAMSKRGTGRTVAVKAEVASTATIASSAVSAAALVDVEDRVGLTDSSSSMNNNSDNVISSAVTVDIDVKMDVDALPCSPSKSVVRDSLLVSSQAHRVAALNVGLAGAAASDVINR